MHETTNEPVQSDPPIITEVPTMEPAAPLATPAAQGASDKFLMPAAVLVAGLLISGSVLWSNANPGAPSAGIAGAGGAPAAAVDISNVKIEGEPFIGEPNAKVVVAFWSDFQCPFCKAFEVGHPQIPTPAAMPEIIKNYVTTGKAKIVFKDLAFLGPDSQTAALYARGVWELYPQKYFEWRTAMYEAQDEEHGGFGDDASVAALTKSIAGIDVTKVQAAITAKKAAYEAIIEANRTEAQEFGLQSTPSVIIGKQAVIGAQPYADFDAAIKTVLK